MSESGEPLTRREKRVLALVEGGASTLTVARRLHIPPTVAAQHLDAIYAKAGFPRGRVSGLVERHELTPVQNQVLSLVLSGATNPLIAARLLIPAREVNERLREIYRRLEVSDRFQAMSVLRLDRDATMVR